MHRLPCRVSAHLVAAFVLIGLSPDPLARADPDAHDARRSDAARADLPLAGLARFAQGEWRTVPANGNQQRDVWTWGPSRQALTSITTNKEASSESIFGSFRVIYRHPQRNELAVLALCGTGLIQTGTLTPLDGLDVRFDMSLSYDVEAIAWAVEPHRTIASVWSFDSPTSYTNSWVEDQGQPVDPSVTAWKYARHDDVTALPANAAARPEQIRHLDAFLPFLESEWETETTRTTLSWIPYNEAILVRTRDTRTGGSVSESVVYPHPHSKAIHVLTVHGSGAIDEGIACVEDGAIVIRAERADRDRARTIEQRIDRLESGAVRVRTWSLEGGERTMRSETVFEAVID